jgi:shikimate kinase
VIYLETSPETIWERVKRTRHRPLLQTEDPREEIRRLLAERESVYNSLPHRVLTDGQTPDQVAKRVLEIVGDRCPPRRLSK